MNEPEYTNFRLKESPTRLSNIGERLFNHLSRNNSIDGKRKLTLKNVTLSNDKSTQTTINDFDWAVRSKPVKRIKLIDRERFKLINKKFRLAMKEKEELIEKIIELSTHLKLRRAHLI